MAAVDFQSAFVGWWTGDAPLASAFPGGLYAIHAPVGAKVPFATASYADAERGVSLDDLVFDVALTAYGFYDTGAMAAIRAASAAILNVPPRPQFLFPYDGRDWVESGALRQGALALSPGFTLDNGTEVWRADQTYRFNAAALFP